MDKSLYDFCIAEKRNELLVQWDSAKNKEISPLSVSSFSNRKVWWICEKGHEYEMIIAARTNRHCACPYCCGKRLLVGFNDLATVKPQLAKEWNPSLNGSLTPEMATVGSHKKVWWICEKKHEWKAAIFSRSNGVGCPVCAGKKIIPGENDLAFQFPDIAAQWHPTKNGNLLPENVAEYANYKVWWVCEKGHEYEMSIKDRTFRHSSCPFCCGKKVLVGFNDLATVNPQLAKEWHPTLNGNLTPEMVTAGSSKKVWWQCSLGHVWKTCIYQRGGVYKHGCPVCNGRYSVKRLERYREIWMKSP